MIGIRIGVGIHANGVAANNDFYGFVGGGQSLMVQWFLGEDNLGTNTPGYDAFVDYLEPLRPDTDKTINYVNGATGGSAVTVEGDYQDYWWDREAEEPGPMLSSFYTAVSSAGISSDDVLAITWDQGTQDAAVIHRWNSNTPAAGGILQSVYEADLRAVFAHMKAMYPNATIFISKIARLVPENNNSDLQAVREAQNAIIANTAYVKHGCENFHREMDDGLHLVNASYADAANDTAHAVADHLTWADTSSIGMKITGAVISGADVVVTVAHDKGTDFTPTTGIVGFKAEVNGILHTPSSAVRTNATTITLTFGFSFGVSDRVWLYYIHDQFDEIGTNDASTAHVVDNAAYPLPMQTYAAQIQAGTLGAPTVDYNFLTLDNFPVIMSCSRTTAAITIDENGLFKHASPFTPRYLHEFGTGERLGLLIEEPISCKNSYARPSAGTTTNHFTSTPAGLSVVTDNTNPAKNLLNGESVWQFANTSGSPVNLEWAGGTSDATAHSIQICYKLVSGSACTLSLEGVGGITLNSSTWARTGAASVVAANTGDNLRLTVPDGATIQFTMANLCKTEATWWKSLNMPVDTIGSAVTTDHDGIIFSKTLNDSEGTFLIDESALSAGEGGSYLWALRQGVLTTDLHGIIFSSSNDPNAVYTMQRRQGSTSPNWSAQIWQTPNPFDAQFGYRYRDGDSKLLNYGLRVLANTDADTLFPTGLNQIALISGAATPQMSLLVRRLTYNPDAMSDREIRAFDWDSEPSPETADGSLRDVIFSAVMDLDATKSASYTSGQTFANLVSAPNDGSTKTNNDFYRGTNSSVTTADPTFNGSAGSASAYFSFDGGDSFKLVSATIADTPTFTTMHRTDKEWFFTIAFRTPSSFNTNQEFFSTRTSTGNGVYVGYNNSTNNIFVNQNIGGTAVIANFPFTLATSTDYVITITFDMARGHGRCAVNENAVIEVESVAFTASTSGNAGATPALMSRSNNTNNWPNTTRLYAVGVGNAFLDAAAMQDIHDEYETRHSRTY